MLSETLRSNKRQIIFVLIVLALGTGALYVQGYFDLWRRVDPLMYGDSQLKLAFGPTHAVLLSYTPEKRLFGHYAASGETVPKDDLVVLGFDVASLVASEKNITISEIYPGFLLTNFSGSGRDFRVAGILQKMNASADMIAFISEKSFEELHGKIVELRRTSDMMPKLFYYVADSDKMIMTTPLSNGSMENYRMDGKYYPLILGRAEADMMLKEKLLSKTGDRIENFFGKPVFLAGIFNSTGTGLDILHYLPEERL
jgi:hypothetical protein